MRRSGQPFECAGHLITTDASIGIALAPGDGLDLDQLLKNADLALYGAKGDGRRTYRFFEAGMDARAKARRMLELELRQAIADGGLEVYYQPVVNLEDGKISSCEALLRWRHPERGMISPAEFIPVAEETGLINQLGNWVLDAACAEAANWPERRPRRGQRLAGPVQEPDAGAQCRRGACRLGAISLAARARDHRGRADSRRRGGAGRAASVARSSACASRWTISAPAIPRSATCSGFRSTRSRSTAPSSGIWPARAPRRRSCRRSSTSPPRAT